MIKLTKLNGDHFYINPHLIEKIEFSFDSVITMNSQVQYVVKEKEDDIKQLIVEYRKEIGYFSQE